MFEDAIYGWYNLASEVANTETGVPEKADYITPPHGEILVQTCQGRRVGFEQTGCKWYIKSCYRGRLCMYDKFDGLVCDKAVVNGKGIN